MENWKLAFLLFASLMTLASVLTVVSVEELRPDWGAPWRFLRRKWQRRYRFAALALWALARAFRAVGEAGMKAEAYSSSLAFRFNCIHTAVYRPKQLDEVGAPI